MKQPALPEFQLDTIWNRFTPMPHPLGLIPLCVLAVNAVAYSALLPLNDIADAHGAHHFAHAFWQTLVGGAMLAGVAAMRREPARLGWPYLRLYLVVGAASFCVPLSLITYVSAHLPTGATSLAFALIPTTTYLFSVVVRIERLSLIGLSGLALGFVGLMIVIAPRLIGIGDPAALPWLLLTLILPVSIGIANVSAVVLRPPEAPPFSAAAGFLLGGALTTLPVVLVSGEMALPLGPGIWWTTLLAGLANAVAIAIFAEAVKRYGPTFYAQVNYMIVLAAIGWGWLVFGEVASVFVWAALVFMALGILVAGKRPGLEP